MSRRSRVQAPSNATYSSQQFQISLLEKTRNKQLSVYGIVVERIPSKDEIPIRFRLDATISNSNLIHFRKTKRKLATQHL